jgi:hypothetical protein
MELTHQHIIVLFAASSKEEEFDKDQMDPVLDKLAELGLIIRPPDMYTIPEITELGNTVRAKVMAYATAHIEDAVSGTGAKHFCKICADEIVTVPEIIAEMCEQCQDEWLNSPADVYTGHKP